MKASWNGVTIAESDNIILLEGNAYFPPETVNRAYLRPSDRRSTCAWKGVASYYTLEVDGQRNADAAWFYPEPLDAAAAIAGRVAFWKGVEVG